MDPEERLFAVLSGKKTDRIPTFSLVADPNVINETLGLKPAPILKFLESDRGSRFVNKNAGILNRFFDPAMFLFGDAIIRVNAKLGFDGVWVSYWRMGLASSKELVDFAGRLFRIVDDGHGNPYMMYEKGLISNPEDWRKWERPTISSYAMRAALLYRAWRRKWKGRIAIVPFVAPGIWENSWQPMSFSSFVSLLRRDEEFAREVIGYFTTLTVAQVEAYAKAGAKVIGYGDDLAYKSGPMLSPELLEKFYGYSFRQITRTAHRHGARIIIHCCGNTEGLLEKFVEWGFDGAHAFEPSAGNDFARGRKLVGDKLCLIGNIDVTKTLVSASREEVVREVKDAIQKAEGGPVIIAPAHTHSDLSVERLRWMIEAARQT